MTDDDPCAYCQHPRVHHAPGRCWTEVLAFTGGWRDCSCATFVEAEATT